MKPIPIRPSNLLPVFILSAVCCSTLSAQLPPDLAVSSGIGSSKGDTASLSPAGEELNWPRIYTNNNVVLSIYQPQIEKWEGEDLESRSAVAITGVDGGAPVYGVFWMHARAEVDKADGIVTLNDIQVIKTRFPSMPEKEAEFLALIRSHVPTIVQNIALDHLEASYSISEAVRKARAVPVKNDPPRIIYTTSPSLLVLVDGPPVLRSMPSFPGVQQVINTAAFMVQTGGHYYLFASDHWYQANLVEGPWLPATAVPAPLEAAKQAAMNANNVDLMPPDEGSVTTTPTIYASTTPAELIETDGPASLVPVEKTDLMEVKNSDNPVFLCLSDQKYYCLISGRWFKAPTLAGPWVFASYKALPSDLARIPADHPRANVLVSVPGTPQAEQAIIANSIPQTASVKRSEAKLQVSYDGPPQFLAIEGTPLAYAVNTPTPVIQLASQSYYAVENGVWFIAPSPNGPWTVAASVPSVIYSIPASCPVHYVTYVRVYSATPEYVYVGYTPGYFGTVVCTDYVVVFGTGWHYRPYIGNWWVGWPCTYGFGAGFACGWNVSFGFGFAAGFPLGVWCHPWWGPYHWGWRHGHRYIHVSINHVNIYQHWGGNVVPGHHPYGSNAWRDQQWPREWAGHFNPYSPRVSFREQPGQYHPYHGNQGLPGIQRPMPPAQEQPKSPRPPATSPRQQTRTPQRPINPRQQPVTPPQQPVIPPQRPVVPPQQPVIPPRQPVTPPQQPVNPPRQPVTPPRQPITQPRQVTPGSRPPMQQSPNISPGPSAPANNNVYSDRQGNIYRYNPPAQGWERNQGNQWQHVPNNRGAELNRDAYGRNLGQQRFDSQHPSGSSSSKPSGGRSGRN